MSFSPLIVQLVHSLRTLPGVGPRTAQRMAMHLLEQDRNAGLRLAADLQNAMEHIGRCESCRTFCEAPLCKVCANEKRDKSLLCIVETPMEMMAIEQSATFYGVYFVLMGRLSPLDGIGPNELKLNELEERLNQDEITEVILALNPTVEGEATANYLTNLVKAKNKKISKIAYGVPFGGELEYVDSSTLAHAFNNRA